MWQEGAAACHRWDDTRISPSQTASPLSDLDTLFACVCVCACVCVGPSGDYKGSQSIANRRARLLLFRFASRQQNSRSIGMVQT